MIGWGDPPAKTKSLRRPDRSPLLIFFQIIFHHLAVVFQMVQLQFRRARFKRIKFLQDLHPQVEEFFLAFFFGFSVPFRSLPVLPVLFVWD